MLPAHNSTHGPANPHAQQQHLSSSAPPAAVDGRKGNPISEERLLGLCNVAGVKYVPPPKDHAETKEKRHERISGMKKRRRDESRKRSGKVIDRMDNKKKKITKMERFLRGKMGLTSAEVRFILPAMVKRLVKVGGERITEDEQRRLATKLITAQYRGEDTFAVASADLEERGAGVAVDNAPEA